MTTISASLVNELRQKTSSGMMECKKALTESHGDLEKAVEILRLKGQLSAAKRADRSATEGFMATKVSADNKKAALIQLNCETDFVSRNENFQAFANQVADLVLSSGVENLDQLLAATLGSQNVSDALTQLNATIGEKIESGQAAFRSAPTGYIQPYIHAGSRLGVLLVLDQASAADTEIVKDLAMQIAAASPLYVGPENVPAELKAKELGFIREQLKTEGKPEAMLAKIAEGKINKYYTDICLLKQAFVKNPDMSVEKHLGAAAPKVKVADFVRFAISK